MTDAECHKSAASLDQPDSAMRALHRRAVTCVGQLGLATLLFAFAAVAGLAKDRKHDKGKASKQTAQIERVGQLPVRTIKESSGIVASRRQEGVLWTHGDSGNGPHLFAIARDGRLLRRYLVGSVNIDWEDIATDSSGNLYIADTGDNDLKRREILVHRIAEPDVKSVATGVGALPVTALWHLHVPGGPANCESLFLQKGHAYLVEKLSSKRPARLFRFPLQPEGGTYTLEVVAHLPLGGPATAADLAPDGRQLAVMTRQGLWVYPVEGDLAQLGRPAPRFLKLPSLQYEAVCFVPDGLLMTAETGEIFRVPLP